jgi:hypothetical protein
MKDSYVWITELALVTVVPHLYQKWVSTLVKRDQITSQTKRDIHLYRCKAVNDKVLTMSPICTNRHSACVGTCLCNSHVGGKGLVLLICVLFTHTRLNLIVREVAWIFSRLWRTGLHSFIDFLPILQHPLSPTLY